MRKVLLLFAMIASLSFTAAPVAMAQDDIDLESISETVMDADSQKLITAMETPMADDDLPAGFSDATYTDPEAATGDEGVLPASDLEGAEGSVAYMVDWDPTSAEGTPEATASPVDDAFAVRIATLNYVFFDQEITSDDLDDFKTEAEKSLQSEGGADASVDTVQFNGTDAVLLTYEINEDDIVSIVQMLAVPVGNTMVISMVVEAGTDVDAEAVLGASEELALAGARHLGTVAEDAK
jgi:hypothetical protein